MKVRLIIVVVVIIIIIIITIITFLIFAKNKDNLVFQCSVLNIM
jgi:hypothetical protein